MKFELTILGTSGAVPAYGRFCSAVFLRSETTDILIDCGEGTQMQLSAAGLGMGRCSTILISHLHGDHYFGLPGLLSSLALSGRTAPLSIYSPQHLRPRIKALFELDRFPMPYELTFETFRAESLAPLLSVGDLEVETFPLRHRTPTNGYLIRERERPANIIKTKIDQYDIPWQAIAGIKEGANFILADGTAILNEELVTEAAASRSFAYCSDTLYFPELAGYVRDVDLLYHEATFLSDLEEDALKKGHSTAAQAAMTAKDAGAGQLVMGHFSTRYPDVSGHETEARTIFKKSKAARDLNRFNVPYQKRKVAAK